MLVLENNQKQSTYILKELAFVNAYDIKIFPLVFNFR